MTEFAYVAAALVAVGFALWVVLARNLLMAALCLMGLLGTTAVIYTLFGYGFLAGMQVLVYVAGTVVLIVFAIMLTHAHAIEDPWPTKARVAGAVLASAAFLACSGGALLAGQFPALPAQAPVVADAGADPVREIGHLLLSSSSDGYLLPLELISLLLLVVLIGGIVLAKTEQAKQTNAVQVGATQALMERIPAERVPAEIPVEHVHGRVAEENVA